MIQLVWRETALDDLDRIVAYIGQFNFTAAERLQDLAEQCALCLIEHPLHVSDRTHSGDA